jgi:hypothetical protein
LANSRKGIDCVSSAYGVQTVESFVREAQYLQTIFEYLLEHAQKWSIESGIIVTRDAVAAALGRAIREGDAKAYLLSPQPPYFQAVEFSRDRIDGLWFYVTPKGKGIIATS